MGIGPETTYYPLLWTLLPIFIHAGGCLAFWLVVRPQSADPGSAQHSITTSTSILDPKAPAIITSTSINTTTSTTTRRSRSLHQHLLRALAHEFTPAAYSSPPPLQSDARRRNNKGMVFLAVSWTTEIATEVHILWGTMFFSATLFLFPNDALVVVARYMASIVVCRMVLLAYEIAGLGQAYAMGERG